MKYLIPVLACLTMAAPVQAQEVLPYLYASEYCQLRRAGVDRQSAIRAAMQTATIRGNNWTYVTIGGQQQRSDIIRGALAVRDLCPHYLSN